MIHFKAGVRFKKFTPALREILIQLDNLNQLRIPNYPVDWLITSVNDSDHLPNSRHYTDEAIDMRSKNFDTEMRKIEFRDRLQFALGTKFTVLYENARKVNEHFHIQVKKGQVYP